MTMPAPVGRPVPTYCVYRLTHTSMFTVYVGATGNLRQRMRMRFRQNELGVFRDPDDWDLEVLYVTPSRREAERLERLEIAKVDPLVSLNGAEDSIGLRGAVADERHAVGPVQLHPLVFAQDYRRRCMKRGHRGRLADFLRNMADGARWSASDVRAELSIPARPWEKLAAELRDPDSELGTLLRERSIEYRTERQGKRNVAHLVRSEPVPA